MQVINFGDLLNTDKGLHAHEAKVQLNKYLQNFAVSFENFDLLLGTKRHNALWLKLLRINDLILKRFE